MTRTPMLARFFLVLLFFLICIPAQAQVEWNEPEVVPERLMRNKRRVLRFSGVTKPGAQIRIRKNKIKLYLETGKVRWASIPQKNAVQFPVVSDKNGEFTFDLYLPTIAVMIPVEIYRKGKWRPYNLNFRVPDEGAADDFQAVAESFEGSDDNLSGIDKSENYYSRQADKGRYAKRDRNPNDPGRIEVWGGAGVAFVGLSVSTPITAIDHSPSNLSIPAWHIGAKYKGGNMWNAQLSVRSTSGSFDRHNNFNIGTDYSWDQYSAFGHYFLDSMKFSNGRLGLDFGLQYQNIPYFRERSTVDINTSYFESNTVAFHVGAHYESYIENKKWPWEAYARYLYAFSNGNNFDIDSSFPLIFEFGGGVKRRLNPGLSMGVYSQLVYATMNTKYNGTLGNAPTDFSAYHFALDFRMIADF